MLVERIQEDIVKHEDLSSEVQEARTILHNENKSRFKEKEREGHVEDLLISTILDPRFKLMNFIGCTSSTKHDAEKYLRSAYNADWSPEAIASALKKVADADKDPNDEKDDDCVEEPLPEPEPEPVASIFKKKVSTFFIHCSPFVYPSFIILSLVFFRSTYYDDVSFR